MIAIEATNRSGSLITSKYALSRGRTVFVVSESPLDPRCSGLIALLKEGAVIISSADYVLENINLI